MANKSFTNWSQIETYLTGLINDTLNKEVKEQVFDEIQTGVSETVYSAGIPQFYERRGGNSAGGMGNSIGSGSLSDPNEMKHTVESGVLEVWDEADSYNPWDLELDEAIAFGYGSKSQWYNVPRNFIETARQNMEESGSHVSSMKMGLRKRGLEVI